MMRDHEDYEVQIALATAGQLTHAERNDLEQHASNCPACRECMAEMAAVSRELFLVQAARIKPATGPAGMQQRFLSRAAAAGVPLNRSTPASLYPQAIRVAAIAVLLAMSLSLTWRIFSAHGADAKESPGTLTAQSNLKPIVDNATVATVTPQHASFSKSQFKRRSALAPHGGSDLPAHSYGKGAHSYFDLQQRIFATQASLPSPLNDNPFWSARVAANPLAANLLASARTSFPSANGASCFGISEEGKPEERACHLEIKLASLSSLDPPQSPDSAPGYTTLRFRPPVFHLSPNPVQ